MAKTEIPLSNLIGGGIPEYHAVLLETTMVELSIRLGEADILNKECEALRDTLKEIMREYPDITIKDEAIGSLSFSSSERVSYSKDKLQKTLLSRITDPGLIKSIMADAATVSQVESITFRKPKVQ